MALADHHCAILFIAFALCRRHSLGVRSDVRFMHEHTGTESGGIRWAQLPVAKLGTYSKIQPDGVTAGKSTEGERPHNFPSTGAFFIASEPARAFRFKLTGVYPHSTGRPTCGFTTITPDQVKNGADVCPEEDVNVWGCGRYLEDFLDVDKTYATGAHIEDNAKGENEPKGTIFTIKADASGLQVEGGDGSHNQRQKKQEIPTDIDLYPFCHFSWHWVEIKRLPLSPSINWAQLPVAKLGTYSKIQPDGVTAGKSTEGKRPHNFPSTGAFFIASEPARAFRFKLTGVYPHSNGRPTCGFTTITPDQVKNGADVCPEKDVNVWGCGRYLEDFLDEDKTYATGSHIEDNAKGENEPKGTIFTIKADASGLQVEGGDGSHNQKQKKQEIPTDIDLYPFCHFSWHWVEIKRLPLISHTSLAQFSPSQRVD